MHFWVISCNVGHVCILAFMGACVGLGMGVCKAMCNVCMYACENVYAYVMLCYVM